MNEIILEMRNISKSFANCQANDQVNLTVNRGEVHAVLGENGAGKSTLMNILTGMYRPDSGEILLDGQRMNFSSPKEAIKNGIGMVHQHFKLVEVLTVTENIILGADNIGKLLNLNKLHNEIRQFAAQYGSELDPNAEIWQLSVGERQRVEIIKMLYRKVNLLILDEPTAVLTPQEVTELFATLRTMAEQGKTIIIITHKLNEVMEIADRITVLRGGKSIATMRKTETNKEELAKTMVGREVPLELNRRSGSVGPAVLKLKELAALNDKGLPALAGLSLDVHRGEIVGIAGVAGNGQKELVEVIAGMRNLLSGSVAVNGRQFTNFTPRDIINAGVGIIPEDRIGTGLAQNFNIVENFVLKSFKGKESSKRGFINWKRLRQQAQQVVEDFEVKTAGLHSPVKLLSGGNQQKLLFAREVSRNPCLIVAAYPCRGLDLGATRAVHKILLNQKQQGAGIILISEDLDELLNLSDRIVVMYEGKITGVVDPGKASIEEIGLMMCGGGTECYMQTNLG